MPINIVLDKSAFQSFNHNELILLNGYYRHNVTQILSFEIIGDLSKEAKEGKKPPAEQVKMLAYRLFPGDNLINVPCHLLPEQELLGKRVPMDGKPIIELERYVDLPDGNKAVQLKETLLEVAISNWKKGEFVDLDFANSASWRDRTTNADLLAQAKALLGAFPFLNNLKSMDEVNAFVEKFIADEQQQEAILMGAIKKYVHHEAEKYNVVQRWFATGRPMLSDFAPYTLYCVKVEMLFQLGILNEHIGNRPTNRLDLQYLYYLPFCDLFCANDKFFDTMIPYLVKTPDQYVKGSILKEDLKQAWVNIHNMSEEERKPFYRKPIVDENSFTFKLWNKYFDYPDNPTFSHTMSEEEMKEMRQNMEAFEQSLKSNGNVGIKGDADLIGRVSYLSKDDPCFICNSGKKLIECCMTEEKFDATLKMQAQDYGNNSDGIMVAHQEYKGKDTNPES